MSLLFPAYLAGLAGLLLPWLLHRFSDQQPEEKLFPSRRFLEETTPPVSRTRKLKYWLLLALRVLSILLLSVLFAQPWLDMADSNADAQTHHIISVDQSLSMRAGDRWEQALERAAALIDELPQGDSIELVAFAQDLQRVADNDESVAALSRALAELEPLYTAADYGSAMQRLNQLASERSAPVKVWLISDQQKSALPSQLNALYAPDVDQWEHVSVVDSTQRNVHLSATADSVDDVNVRVSVQLLASVARPQGVDSVQPAGASVSTVQVVFGEQILAEESMPLQAEGVEARVLDNLIMPPGANPVLQIRLLEDDALMDDNAVSLTIRKANPTPVVLLQPDRSTRDSAAVFVTTALETDSLAQVETIAGTADRVPPETLHVITAGDVSASSLALDVLQFVDTGANALVFDNSVADSPAATDLRGVGIGLIDESHPLGLGQIDWFGTRFYDMGSISLQADDRVLVETADRVPVLVERSSARGTLLLLNDRLDGLSSNLPLQPAFVGLMQAVLNYFDATTAIPDQVLAGTRLSLPGNVQLLDSENNAMLLLGDSARAGGAVLVRPGLYKVVSARGEQTVRATLDPVEADLSLVSEEALAAWRARYDEPEATDDSGSASTTAIDPLLLAKGTDSERFSLWRWLLPAMVLIWVLESAFANRRLDVRRDGS